MQVLRHQIPARAAPRRTASVSRSAPAGAARPPRPFQLPPAVADFTGRAEQIAQLDAMLRPDGSRSAVPVVVLSGPPGVGKTTLMVRAAQAIRRFFPDGQLWAQLNGASDHPRDPADVIGEFLRALGVPGSEVPDSAHERAALYRSRLADQRVLVVADDAAAASQVLPLLPGTAGCAVVVTSRRQLTDLPGAQLVMLSPLTQDEATELVGRIAGRTWGSADPQAAADLVAGCGLLPLALRIAGAKLAARGPASVAALAKAVTDERNRLNALQIGDLSVRASLASGYQSLSEPAQRAFRLLGSLGPGDIAEWVIAALLGTADASTVVSELCDRSMLTLVGADPTGQSRFRLHDLLRDYAAEELAREPAAHQAAALRRAHDGWLQLAATASAHLAPDPFFPAGAQTRPPAVLPVPVTAELTADPLAWFAAERLNLFAVAGSACRDGRYRFAGKLATSLAAYQHIQDRHHDAEAIWSHVAAAARRAGDTAAMAEAQLRIGAALVQCCRARVAVPMLDECLGVFERSANADALAAAWYWRAECAWEMDAFEQGPDYAQRGVAVAEQAGNTHARWLNLRSLTNCLGSLGCHAEPLDAGERALVLAAQFPGDVHLAVTLHTVAVACNWIGEWERAIALSQRTLRLSRSLGDARLEALTLALPKFTELANERFEALCLLKRGAAYQALGQLAAARQDLARLLPVFRRRGMSRHEQRALRVLDDGHPAALGSAIGQA